MAIKPTHARPGARKHKRSSNVLVILGGGLKHKSFAQALKRQERKAPGKRKRR